MSKLEIYMDFKSPYAFIAKDANYALEEEFGIEIDWYPLTLNIKSYLGSAKKEAGKIVESNRSSTQWLAVKYAYMDARRYANLTGKTVRGTIKIWDSSLAGIALLWAKRSGSEALDRLLDVAYLLFWRRDLDIENVEALESVLAQAGISVDGFQSFLEGEGRAAHDALNEAAFDAGVYGVPTYLVGDEAWFGREHLPRVEWLLSGRGGDAPVVSNRNFAS